MGKSVQVHKPHKTRFASKSTRHLHRVSQTDKIRTGKGQKNLKGARTARLHHNKIVRDKKRATILKDKRSLIGASSPRVIVLFGLSSNANTSSVKNDLLELLLPEGYKGAASTVASAQYKIRIMILEAPHGDLLSCMELAKVADLIAFVASGNSIRDGSESNEFIDTFGIQCLSALRALGLPSTAVLIRDLPTEMKRRQEIKKMCISRLGSELPEECKYYLADTKDDLHKFMWLSKEQQMSSPHWRQHRPYLLSEKVDVVPDNANPGKCYLCFSGYVRAHTFSVNQLVHVSGAGDFQLVKIDVLKDPVPITDRKNLESMESDELYKEQVLHTLLPDSSKLQPLLVENVPDPLAGEQTWPTEAEIVEAVAANKVKKLKRTIPQGTSDYQAAWIVDDTVNKYSDDDDDQVDGMVTEDGQSGYMEQDAAFSDTDEDSYSIKDMDALTDTDTVMMDDENLTREQIEAEIQRIKEAHAEDEEFPDEVDSPLDIPARKRFAKYRGLKSFRTSSWDPKESLPPEYARIFAFDNFTRTQKHVLAKVTETDMGSMDEVVPVGSYVRLYVTQVPTDIALKLCLLSKKFPITASGLLQHESKMSVLHFSLKKHDSYGAPIKSKETLIFHLGFRQFIVRPIFSSDNFNSDKHKLERFLHSGQFSIASVYAPISFPPQPLVALKVVEGSPVIAATGSLRCVDPDRIILKRIILTGYPQKVSKLKASVRFMFHNPDDVRWFTPVELWTKCGRRGRVKESVGTHGAMKCIFNGVVQQHDTVCMSLYKRIYPKWPENKYAVLDHYC